MVRFSPGSHADYASARSWRYVIGMASEPILNISTSYFYCFYESKI